MAKQPTQQILTPAERTERAAHAHEQDASVLRSSEEGLIRSYELLRATGRLVKSLDPTARG